MTYPLDPAPPVAREAAELAARGGAQPWASRGGRERVAGWLLGLGLALLALAFPQERLVGEAFAGGFERSPLWALWHRLGRSLGQGLGVHGEQVRFGLAALAYGACLPAALGLARRLGCPLGRSLVTGSILLLSPTAWLAGTTPGMTSISLLLSLTLMRALLGPETRGLWLRPGLWGLLVGTQVSALLLWPAVALASLPPKTEAVARRRAGRTSCGAGLAVLALVVGTRVAEWDPVPFPSELDFSATIWSLDGRAWQRIVAVVPGLGLALVGLTRLRFVRREGSGPSARRWLLLWCAGPAAFLLLNSTLTWDASYHWLLAPALIGLCHPPGRARSRSAAGLGTAAVIAQLALLLGLQQHVTRTDPLRDWRAAARTFLEPRDTVITGHARHAYLCSHRFGVQSVVLGASDPLAPSPSYVDGVYIDETGQTNLRVKTQDLATWADEGIEARGLGLRVILDRPFPGSSKVISDILERELRARIELWSIDSNGPAAGGTKRDSEPSGKMR